MLLSAFGERFYNTLTKVNIIMLEEQISLLNKAKEVLRQNWKDGFTVPSSKLYPFQWNWDSGFVSLGFAHFNLAYAISELRSLFSGQWANGMIPHIIFHSENETTYFPNFEFWQTEVNSGASLKPRTSGITQPPVHAFILEGLLNAHPKNEALLDFARELYPKIIASHRFFYQYRDPQNEGLVFIYHPWESGRDNSPLWDDSLARIEIDPQSLPNYQRKDTQLADSEERPTRRQYDCYVYLLELGKKYAYDGPQIAEESPFLIQDSLINAILIKSNQSLINIGSMLGFDMAEVEAWQAKSLPAFRQKLWNESLGCFLTYDLRANAQILQKEIGGIFPLFAGIPDKMQAARINQYLIDLHQRNFFICPSYDVDSDRFDSKRYWRGPVWPHMNWMIYHGLKAYGYPETAEIVRNDTIHLVDQFGFFEYFEAQKALADQIDKGYGGTEFSWTASSIIDLILNP
ncbi:MAG: trehalase family glycosidase [Bacteroidota bacterium]